VKGREQEKIIRQGKRTTKYTARSSEQSRISLENRKNRILSDKGINPENKQRGRTTENNGRER
jgi:hypothetical protein